MILTFLTPGFMKMLAVTNPPQYIPVLSYLADPPAWLMVVYGGLILWGFITVALELLRPRSFTPVERLHQSQYDDNYEEAGVPGEWR